jgi:hypothetical protein
LQQYFAWFAQITPDVAETFLPFTLTIERYGDAIFNYFRHRVTAGYTESLNGLLKLLAHQGRGFSFEVIRAKVLLTNGLRKTSRSGYDKVWEASIPSRTTRFVESDITDQTAFAMACPSDSGAPLPTALIAPPTVKFGNSKLSDKP